jgi:hypothetical protein
MELDLALVRKIMRSLGTEVPSVPHVITDTFILGYTYQDIEADHLDLLVQVGWVRPSHDLHMRNHPDPVTYRPKEEGKLWVRRAWNDAEWETAIPEARAVLDQAAEGFSAPSS